MMKKLGCKTEKGRLEHIVDYNTFMTDDELRKKYCKIEIEKTAYTPCAIMNFDEFIESERNWDKELKREDTD